MKNRIIFISVLLLSICCTYTYAQLYMCDYEVTSDNTILVKMIYNNDNNHFIKVYIDGANDNAFCGAIDAGKSLPINKNCSRFVKIEIQGGSMETILDAKSILQERKEVCVPNIEVQSESKKNTGHTTPRESIVDKAKTLSNAIDNTSPQIIDANEILKDFSSFLEMTSYYSTTYFNKLKSDVDSYIDAMKYMDQEHKRNYISEKQLNGYVLDAENNLNQHKLETNHLIENFISKYSEAIINDEQKCREEMFILVSTELREREEVIAMLKTAISDDSVTSFVNKILNDKSTLMNIGICLVILIVVGGIIFRIRQKRNAKEPTVVPTEGGAPSEGIVVRRKTTSILKKQSLEDVQNNPSYLKIDCAEFCEDSAVRRIYFKNTCIKDIYNMYEEDLRNPENPNEDGCMVLGRWTHDSDADEYYVSLEEIVKPGDDAVFQEYELNFGGKIKLKVSEKLRKLRRETNLQYDMTCWVHSHPGLGVFFSNADSSVQMQLKHPTHPKFLTALVIDILTPDQELGIFTFKHDMTINSKAELKKMYSLEEMYKWAVSSDRNSYKKEDYYNLMSTAKMQIDECSAVQLSNGSIIDMCQMGAEQDAGLVGWVHGFECKERNKNEYVISKVSKEDAIPDNDLLGCFVIGTHRSIPTIRKIITNVRNIRFVLFYSTTDGHLTSIPVVNDQIVTDEIQYGEEKLEELKIWTRRKR